MSPSNNQRMGALFEVAGLRWGDNIFVAYKARNVTLGVIRSVFGRFTVPLFVENTVEFRVRTIA